MSLIIDHKKAFIGQKYYNKSNICFIFSGIIVAIFGTPCFGEPLEAQSTLVPVVDQDLTDYDNFDEGIVIDHPELNEFDFDTSEIDAADDFIQTYVSRCMKSIQQEQQSMIPSALTQYIIEEKDNLLIGDPSSEEGLDNISLESSDALAQCVAELMAATDVRGVHLTSTDCHLENTCATSDVPGPYFSKDLTFYWYKPFLDPEWQLSRDDYPPAFSRERKKAIIIIHGWRGWHKKTFRQKLRFIHNAKEDILFGGAMLMDPIGLDLTFSVVSGDPRSDDLGAVLQCGPHPESRVAQKEQSLVNFLQTSAPGGCNIDRSYNVGYIDWSQAIINTSVEDSEKKLWITGDPGYISDQDILKLMKDVLQDLAPDVELTLIGHSLGASFAIRVQNVLLEALESKELSSFYQQILASRLIMVDPYFSNFGIFPFDADYWPGKRARNMVAKNSEIIRRLRRTNEWGDQSSIFSENPRDYLSVAIYSTRDDHTELYGDENQALKYEFSEGVYFDLKSHVINQGVTFTRRRFQPHFLGFPLNLLDNVIASYVSQSQRRHIYPLYWVLDHMARGTFPSHTDDLRISRDSRGGGWYRQEAGEDTIDPQDDEFKFILHLP
ncbi:MAG: hypothetical protein OXC40_02275 [Proteobacteria bacterium]|nr:hypothetical protein [Pseudomonadota bacterium]